MRYASLLNGEIIVDSEEGKGSRFSFHVNDFQKEIRDDIHVHQELVLKEAAATIETTKDVPENIPVENVPLIVETIPSIEQIAILRDY